MPPIHIALDGGQNSFTHPADIGPNQLLIAQNVVNRDKGTGTGRRDGSTLYRDLNLRADIFGPGPLLIQMFAKWTSRIGERLIAVANGVVADVTDAVAANWSFIRNDLDVSADMDSAGFSDKLVLGNGKRNPVKVEYVASPGGKIYGHVGATHAMETLDSPASYSSKVSAAQIVVPTNYGVDERFVYIGDTTDGLGKTRIIVLNNQTMAKVKEYSVTFQLAFAPSAGCDTPMNSDLLYFAVISSAFTFTNTGIAVITKSTGAVVAVPATNNGVALRVVRDIHADSLNAYTIEDDVENGGQIVLIKRNPTTLAVVGVPLFLVSDSISNGELLTGDETGTWAWFVHFRSDLGIARLLRIHKATMAVAGSLDLSSGFQPSGVSYDGRNILVARDIGGILLVNSDTFAITAITGPVTVGIATYPTSAASVYGSGGFQTSDVTGLPQPTVTTAVGVSTIPAGTYQMAMTWDDIGRGESGVSPWSVPIVVAAGGTLAVSIERVLILGYISQPTLTTNPYFLRRRVYVRDITGLVPTTYKNGQIVHVVTISTAVATAANANEATPNSLTVLAIPHPGGGTGFNGVSISPLTISPQVISAKIVEPHSGHMYLAGDPGNVGMVQRSLIGNLDYYPVESFSSLTGLTDADSQVQSLVSSTQRLNIFARDTIGYARDLSATTFDIISMTGEYGSIIFDVPMWDELMFHAEDDGIYAWNGSGKPNKISWPVEDLYRAITAVQRAGMVAAVEPRLSQIWFAFASRVLVYDTFKNAWSDFDFSAAGFTFSFLTTFEDLVEDQRRIFAGTTNGRILLMNDGNSDVNNSGVAVPIPWRIVTGIIQGPYQMQKKHKHSWLDVQGYFPALGAPNALVQFRYLMRTRMATTAGRDVTVEYPLNPVGPREKGPDTISTVLNGAATLMRPRIPKRFDGMGDAGDILGIMIDVSSSAPTVDDKPFILYRVSLDVEGIAGSV